MKVHLSFSQYRSLYSPLKPGGTNPRRTILGLSVCMALQMTSFVMVQPLFARRFDELGAGVEALGISAMAYALTSALAAPFMGALADRFGRRALALASLAGYAMALCGYMLASSAEAFILLRGFTGIFIAGLIPAVTGLAADLAPQDRQAQWIGFINAGASVGWIAGPIAGGIVYDHWGYSAALIVSILMALITFLAALLDIPGKPLTPGLPSADAERRASSRKFENIPGYLLNLRKTLPHSLYAYSVLLFISFAVLFAWTFIEPRFMFYAYNDLGWSSAMLGMMMSTYGVALMFGELAFGQLSDRLGRKPVIVMGLALFSAQFIGLALFRNELLIAAAFIIAGLGNALYDPALSASILDISPLEYRSRSLGIKSMAGSCGSILGPALVALLNSSIDAGSIFLMAAGAVLFTTLIGLTYPARKRRPMEEPGSIAGSEKEAPSRVLKAGTSTLPS